MTSAHISLDALEAASDRVLDLAKRLALAAIVVPHVDKASRPTNRSKWHAFAARVAEAGAPFRAEGFQFGWHNHDFELADLGDSSTPLDALAEAGLSLELDIGWVVRAGREVVDIISRHSTRIAAVHLKDLAPAGAGADEDGWADVGHGTVDWAAVHSALQSAGVSRYVLEHDNPSNHERFATRSVAAIAGLPGMTL